MHTTIPYYWKVCYSFFLSSSICASYSFGPVFLLLVVLQYPYILLTIYYLCFLWWQWCWSSEMKIYWICLWTDAFPATRKQKRCIISTRQNAKEALPTQQSQYSTVGQTVELSLEYCGVFILAEHYHEWETLKQPRIFVEKSKTEKTRFQALEEMATGWSYVIPSKKGSGSNLEFYLSIFTGKTCWRRRGLYEIECNMS